MSKSKTRFDISDKDIAELFNDDFQEKKNIPWKTNGAYKVWFNILRFFRNPYPKEKKELDLLDVVDLLISTGDPENVADSCKQYVDLHRIVENTRARRRLEKWVTRLISSYLFFVFAFIVASYTFRWEISGGIIVTLLSTTTINIVALGLILVRGLFHQRDDKDLENEHLKK
jgi:hypothetical protein